MKKLVMLAAVLAASVGAAIAANSGTKFAEEAIMPFIESGELPGAISILCKDGVEEVACLGYADVAAQRRITLDDAFMQCSQTKGFCGVTAAILVEEGRLDLDDPVSKYLPEFKTLWVLDGEADGVRTLRKARTELTVRMCLNHTGGFPFETVCKQGNIKGGGWTGGAPLRQNAAVAAACPILFDPGTGTRYSNTGIDIAAAVVEVVAGMKWEDFLQKRVLNPLGMTATTCWPTDEQLKTRIQMYRVKKGEKAQWMMSDAGGWQQPPFNDSHVFASAGAGLWTTARDQLKFYKMLMNLGIGENGVRILKPETVKSLLAVSTRPAGLGGYSLGLNAPDADGENEFFGHGGAWGTNCMVNWHKKELAMWVQQLEGNSKPWQNAWDAAKEKFFSEKVDDSGVREYTGRLN